MSHVREGDERERCVTGTGSDALYAQQRRAQGLDADVADGHGRNIGGDTGEKQFIENHCDPPLVQPRIGSHHHRGW